MIRIHEKDALWRFYKRYYKHTRMIPPEPGNLCNYFWKSVFGAFKMFFWDANYFLTTGTFAAFTILMCRLAESSNIFRHVPDTIIGEFFLTAGIIFFALTIGFLGGCTIAASLFRFFDYWSQKDERVCYVGGTLLATSGFAFIISMSFVKKDGPWHWSYLLYSFGVELLIAFFLTSVFAIWYLFFSGNTNLGKNILQFLGVLKSRACPLVDPPQSYKDAQREAEINCSDG